VDAPYQRLATDLRSRITGGEWPPGARVPSARHLGAEYRVSRSTVQLAVAQLRKAGILEGRPGARLTVAYPPAVRTLIDPDAPWPHSRGDTARGTCRPTPELRERLRVSERARLSWERTELLDADGRPAMLVTTWQRGAPRPHVGAVCELRPHLLTALEAAALGLATGAAALLVERSRLDGSGLPVQVADLVLPADRWRVRVQAEAADF
jgi:GntR family transcriptional regulator